MDIGCWLLDICTFNTCFLSLRTVRGQGETNTTKEKSNMDFTLDFDVVVHK